MPRESVKFIRIIYSFGTEIQLHMRVAIPSHNECECQKLA